ncbi:hypothetical protein HHK36_010473 [Tetracentron sinense]|uniref:F-box domain-containing protein n=1 Tax=Tetracentron sinense TaxID=13715 RepID=A0A834ZEY8_TETSI|nr:hypothetical protein HHK36_010473 [Tetracentron sinense]
MANTGYCKRSTSGGKTALLSNNLRKEPENRMIVERFVGEASLQRDLDALSVSKRLVRSISQKLGKKSHGGVAGEEEGNERRVSSRCLGLYSWGGGCKVGADTSVDFGDGIGRRRSSAGEEVKGYQRICGTDENGVDCFAHGVGEKFWKRNSRKERALEEPPQSSSMHHSLPDDLLEMCLVKLSLTTLMTARLVCKKWRSLTTTPQFMQMRREGLHQSPWLFLLGVVKDGYCTGQIHALDVSIDQWHRIDADILKGRFFFSTASVETDVYVVGGRSSLTNFGKVDKVSFKTHKGVMVFRPLTGSWHEVAPMKYARSTPILGVFEVSSDCSIFRIWNDRQDRPFLKSRMGGVSDVYEDPHMLSLRPQLRNTFNENEASSEPKRKPCKFIKHENIQSNPKDCRRFVLIAVGGLGSWDEPLYSGEIYDPASNKWTEIARLPRDFGVVCSGVVCNGMFYVYSETDKLAAYDLERGIWIGILTTPSPPRLHDYYPKVISCNGRLFMLCVSWCEGDGQIGRRDKAATRKLWELDLTFLTWTEVSIHPDAPMDWNAAYVADRNLIFGVEMFKVFGQVLDFFTVCDVSDSGLKWNRISRKPVAHELDASSCMTKSMAVLHL